MIKKLPIGHNTLATLIDNDCVYIDKTPLIAEMTRMSGRFFLARPRRFGKSLLVDTLKELFEGNQQLFKGLYIEKRWEWTRQYPVVKIDFAEGVVRNRAELDQRIYSILKRNYRDLGLEACDWSDNDIAGWFSDLIEKAISAYGQRVVILIDEYDKPILDNIDHPERAIEIREGLKNLYSVMKARDAEIHFIFMTGVTKFSKVSLFSGLNQLQDITLDQRYATLCGYTQHDLETQFSEHLKPINWQKLKKWYNGYSFCGDAVYNPFDILLFISKGLIYHNYWFESGSPSFLIKLFQKQSYFLPSLESIDVSEEILDSFDIEQINPVTLLFQSGYLTISEVLTRRSRQIFRLRIPNQEVRAALFDQLIDAYTEQQGQDRLPYQDTIYDLLISGVLDGLPAIIKRLFAFFASLHATVIPEDITNHGQVDLTIIIEERIYCLEIKLEHGEPPTKPRDINHALQQIIDEGYSEKYLNQNAKTLFEVGLVFNSQARNLVQADWRQRI